MCNTIRTVEHALASTSRHALHALTHYCLAPKADYIAQHAYPEHSRDALRCFDDALRECSFTAMGATGPLVASDDFARRRHRLPIRLRGLGLRSRVDVADAAFAGAVCATLPRMLDRALAVGGRLPGFCDLLSPTLGAGSFDEANRATRFAHLLAHSRVAPRLRVPRRVEPPLRPGASLRRDWVRRS